jgi:hypothetical protein
MSMPDLSTLLSKVPASPNAHLPNLIDLVPQGFPPSHFSSTDPQEPNSHSRANLHAGGGIIDHASAHAQGTLPDLVSLTGHDWFIHS